MKNLVSRFWHQQTTQPCFTYDKKGYVNTRDTDWA